MPSSEQRLAPALRRRPLDDEAALGADRHDQRVLDHLRLHQPEDLGAEVLAPVRPAHPAARDPAAAQVHALDARRVDEDLELRPRQRQHRDLRRVELERQVRVRLPSAPCLEVVGPQDRPHDTTGSCAGCGPRRGSRRRRSRASISLPSRSAASWSWPSGSSRASNSPTSRRAISGWPSQRALHVRVGEGDARLAQVLGDRAHDRDLPSASGSRRARGRSGRRPRARPARRRGTRPGAGRGRVSMFSASACEAEVVDPRRGRHRPA